MVRCISPMPLWVAPPGAHAHRPVGSSEHHREGSGSGYRTECTRGKRFRDTREAARKWDVLTLERRLQGHESIDLHYAWGFEETHDQLLLRARRLGRRCLVSALARACHTQDPVAYVSCEGSQFGYVVASRVVARTCHTQDPEQNGLKTRNSKPFFLALLAHGVPKAIRLWDAHASARLTWSRAPLPRSCDRHARHGKSTRTEALVLVARATRRGVRPPRVLGTHTRDDDDDERLRW